MAQEIADVLQAKAVEFKDQSNKLKPTDSADEDDGGGVGSVSDTERCAETDDDADTDDGGGVGDMSAIAGEVEPTAEISEESEHSTPPTDVTTTEVQPDSSDADAWLARDAARIAEMTEEIEQLNEEVSLCQRKLML